MNCGSSVNQQVWEEFEIIKLKLAFHFRIKTKVELSDIKISK